MRPPLQKQRQQSKCGALRGELHAVAVLEISQQAFLFVSGSLCRHAGRGQKVCRGAGERAGAVEKPSSPLSCKLACLWQRDVPTKETAPALDSLIVQLSFLLVASQI